MFYGGIQIVVIEYSRSVIRERVKNPSDIDVSFN